MEIKVIGSKNCGRCQMVKQILDNKSIEYKYSLLEDFSEEEQNDLINKAKNTGNMQFPLIIKDNKIITLQEV